LTVIDSEVLSETLAHAEETPCLSR